jgi:tetratricopeptide (TPR) repeat protein
MISVRFQAAFAILFSCVFALPLRAQSNDALAAQLASEGQQAMAQGRMIEAKASFEKLAKLEPSVGEVHATLAAICFKLKDYEKAVSEIQIAKKLKPGLPRLDSLLGLSLAELNRFDQALPKLEHGFEQSSDTATRRMCGLQLLRAYSGLNRDSDAVKTALELNRLYPDDPEVLYHTGRIYGNYAYIVMEKLHDQARGSVWMFQAQGEANESQKNYDAAIIAFNHVLQIDPNRPAIHYRLGRVYLSRFNDAHKGEDREAAKREFLAELEVYAANGNAAYELAQMAADDGDMDEARKQYESLVARFPDFEQALVGLGGVYLQVHLEAQAVPILERATRLNADDEVAWYRLAQAERATGNREAAQKSIEKFRKLYAIASVVRSPVAADEVTPQQLGADARP